jgi:UDP-N-acetylmuramoyl-tripeptide--D-alanyl-D-alanine ligase
VTEAWVVFALGLAPWGVLTVVRLRRFLHILQLEEYLTPQYARWLGANASRYLRLEFLWPAALGLAFAVIAVAWMSPVNAAIGAGIWAAAAIVLIVRSFEVPKAKKPLVMTARARRMLVVAAALVAAFVALFVGVGLLLGDRDALVAGMIATVLACTFAGHIVLLANLALWPLEERSRGRFQAMAARKLAEQKPRIIAITGSAGKTTTKELVAHLLSARYRVLRTPASFNTPLGIARTVNDSLQGQEYFVIEMGAYKRGEIAKLCRLVGGTDVSSITTVNAQHLERFGSLEATAEAKFEIVEGLRPGGTAVLNFDVPAIRERALRPFDTAQGRQAQDERGFELVTFGVESDDVTLRGCDVVETDTGIEFDVLHDGKKTHVKTLLLARHNVGNVLAAFGMGLSCGLDIEYMAGAIRQFRPPQHRLEPVEAGGITVLDDAYNANPEGIIGAIEVLGRYAPRRRVLVTPGLIEMGKEKAAYHARIGSAASANVDVAFLVGPKQTADIKEAMLAASFPASSLHVTRSFDEAREALSKIGAAGDVVLYANDLPDQFDEFLVI